MSLGGIVVFLGDPIQLHASLFVPDLGGVVLKTPDTQNTGNSSVGPGLCM